MATRRIDLESALGRVAQRPAPSVDPAVPVVTDVPAAAGDLSPFTRPQPASPQASRAERISKAAYRRAEQRNFAPGRELEDWLAAEREIDGERTD